MAFPLDHCCQNQKTKCLKSITAYVVVKNFVMNRYKVINYFLKEIRRLPSGELPLLDFASFGKHWRHTRVCYCSKELIAPEKLKNEPSVFDPVEKLDLSNYGSAVSSRFNFAMYADKSPLIQKLIDLGVDLYSIEKYPETAQYLLSLTDSKIESYLRFLTANGVPEDMLGKVITKNPAIFQEDLDDLNVRINYLKSKKFDKEMISVILLRNPRWLSKPVKVIDERLGYLQQTFHLKGHQVRQMITQVPSLALIEKRKITSSTYALKEEMGLDFYSLRRIVVSEPRLLRLDPYDFVATYEYLLKTMKVSRDLILKQPKVLTYRRFHLRERHKFLESLGRAQYSHLLPGYVNLMDLVETSDVEFCEKIAKSSVEVFNEFLKTL